MGFGIIGFKNCFSVNIISCCRKAVHHVYVTSDESIIWLNFAIVLIASCIYLHSDVFGKFSFYLMILERWQEKLYFLLSQRSLHIKHILCPLSYFEISYCWCFLHSCMDTTSSNTSTIGVATTMPTHFRKLFIADDVFFAAKVRNSSDLNMKYEI